LQLVERVVINAKGRIKWLELKPPFKYLVDLEDQTNGGEGSFKSAKIAKRLKGKTGSVKVPQGGREGIRTHDLYSAIVPLSQLSYAPAYSLHYKGAHGRRQGLVDPPIGAIICSRQRLGINHYEHRLSRTPPCLTIISISY
jgi:hypothetical protein